MERITSIIEAVEIVARAHEHFDFENACGFKLRKSRQRWRLAAGEVSKDKPEVFAGRVTFDPHTLGEPHGLSGLIDASTPAVVFPAVIEATNAIAFDPADRKT